METIKSQPIIVPSNWKALIEDSGLDILEDDFMAEDAESTLASDLRPFFLALQRLSRLGVPAELAVQLMQNTSGGPVKAKSNGLHSACVIAATPLRHFIDLYGRLGGDRDQAKTIHTKAEQVRNRIMHLWAGLQNRSGPLPRMLQAGDSSGLENLPDYQALFGSLNYLEVDHHHSIFSASAYLLDLLRVVNNYISEPEGLPETIDAVCQDPLDPNKVYFFKDKWVYTCFWNERLIASRKTIVEVFPGYKGKKVDAAVCNLGRTSVFLFEGKNYRSFSVFSGTFSWGGGTKETTKGFGLHSVENVKAALPAPYKGQSVDGSKTYLYFLGEEKNYSIWGGKGKHPGTSFPRKLEEHWSFLEGVEVYGALRDPSDSDILYFFAQKGEVHGCFKAIDKSKEPVPEEAAFLPRFLASFKAFPPLFARRPDLEKLPLTIENTLQTKPFAQHINQLLCQVLNLDVRALNQEVFPFGLPFDADLSLTRAYLAQLGTTLAEVYAALSPKLGNQAGFALASADDCLGCSAAFRDLLLNGEESKLGMYFGLPAELVKNLTRRDIFLQQTQMTWQQLDDLFQQGVETGQLQEFAPEFYINKGLENGLFWHTEPDSPGQHMRVLLKIDAEDYESGRYKPAFMSLHKVIRLARLLGWSFAETDWALSCLDKEAEDAEVFWETLAQLRALQKHFNVSVIEACALIGPVKTFGAGHMFQSAKETLSQLPDLNTKLDSLDDLKPHFGLLAAWLRIPQKTLDATVALVDWSAETSPTVLYQISVLYRTVFLMKKLGLTPGDLAQSQYLLEQTNTPFILATPSLAQVQALVTFSSWRQEAQLSTQLLGFICDDTFADSCFNQIWHQQLNQFFSSFWAHAPELLLRPEQLSPALKADERESWDVQQLFDALLEAEVLHDLSTGYETAADSQPLAFVKTIQTAIEHKGLDNAILDAILKRQRQNQERFIQEQLQAFFQDATPQVLVAYTLLTEGLESGTEGLLFFQSADSCDESIQTFFKYMTRLRALLSVLDLNLEHADHILTHPQFYQWDPQLGMPTCDQVRQLWHWQQLRKDDVDGQLPELVNALSHSEDPLNALVQWSGWSRSELKSFLPFKSGHEWQISDLLWLSQVAQFVHQLGCGPAYLALLLPDEKGTLQSTETIAQQTKALIQAQAGEQHSLKRCREAEAPVQERIRDLLSTKLQLHFHLKTKRELSDFLLVDVEMSSASEISPIKEGHLAVQTYLNRCRMNLETLVKQEVPTPYWDWLMSYRVWEANRKVFLYPENYLEPALRPGKTPAFEALAQNLSQQSLSSEVAEALFAAYFDQFCELAGLIHVGCYRCRISTANSEDVDTLFLLARTARSPYKYFWRQCQYPDQENPSWYNWQAVPVVIKSDRVAPVFFLNRLMVFWVEYQSGSEPQFSIFYTYQLEGGTWAAPQALMERETILSAAANGQIMEAYREVGLFVYGGRSSSSKLWVQLGPPWNNQAARRFLIDHSLKTTPCQNLPFRSGSRESGTFLAPHRVPLNYACHSMGATTLGNYALFAGGRDGSSRELITVYQWVDGRIEQAPSLYLKHPSDYVSGATVGSTVVFACVNPKEDSSDHSHHFFQTFRLGSKGIESGEISDFDWWPMPYRGMTLAAIGSYLLLLAEEGIIALQERDGKWVYCEQMSPRFSSYRNYAAATVVGDYLFVSGGEGPEDGPVLKSIEVFKFEDGQLSPVDITLEMAYPRSRHTAVTICGQACFLGGSKQVNDSWDYLIHVDRFGFDQDSVIKKLSGIKMPPEVPARRNLAAAALNNQLLVLGGRDPSGNSLKEGWCFELAQKPYGVGIQVNPTVFVDKSYDKAVLGGRDAYVLDGQFPGTPTSRLAGDQLPDRQLFESHQMAKLAPEHPNFQLRPVANHPASFFLNRDDAAFAFLASLNDAGRLLDESTSIRDFNFHFEEAYQGDDALWLLGLSTSRLHDLLQEYQDGGLKALFDWGASSHSEVMDVVLDNSTWSVEKAQKNIFSGPFANYFVELFFYTPLLIARSLQDHGLHSEAQRWYHFIFNPMAQRGRYWSFYPFKKLAEDGESETLEAILSNEAAIRAYNETPFNPYAIADLRPMAYQKNVVMGYIENLLAWGDACFARDTWEAIAEAALLYTTAWNVLGPRPDALGQWPLPDPRCFDDIRQSSEEIPQFLILLENLSQATEACDGTPFNALTAYFGVTPNKDLARFWDQVEDRLFKIRHSMNIRGEVRSLDLFEPELDPMQLVRAAASGQAPMLMQDLAQVARLPYRFEYLLERTKSLASTTTQLGNNLLSALEKQDAEALSALRSSHEKATLQMITSIKQGQIEEANDTLGALQSSLTAATARRDHAQSLIDKGLLQEEVSGTEKQAESQSVIIGVQAVRTAAGVARSIPTIFGLANGGADYGAPLEATAQGIEIGATKLGMDAALSNAKAGFKRRQQEWELQLQNAEQEMEQIQRQIEAQQIRLEIVRAELANHQSAMRQAEEIEQYLSAKFSSKDLYRWMASRLSSVYFQTYKLSLETAMAAQRAYQFELNRNDTFIQFDHWDNQRKGLLAGESLALAIGNLEKAYIHGNHRRLEIEKVISLKKDASTCNVTCENDNKTLTFQLPQKLFDNDFENHYQRLIKTIAITIPAVVGPYQNLYTTLSQTYNATQSKPDKELLEDWRPQSVVLSRGVNDSGLFELNLRDERYLPFEGTGAISNWSLTLEGKQNDFSFDPKFEGPIPDVIVRVQYTALEI